MLIEASEHGRRSVPDLATPALFERALPGAPGALPLAWETERAAAPSLGDVVRALRRDGSRWGVGGGGVLAAGRPRGGFTAAEAAAARARGAIAVSLGPRILRAETAALAALAIIADALHEGGRRSRPERAQRRAE
ncbi:MAG: 16S rRNA (uracil(1498)-N(3))-methyltransferase [Dehalococcoidia bacterium]